MCRRSALVSTIVQLFFLSLVTLQKGSGEAGRGGMDLLGELQLHNLSREGVTLTPGPHKLKPAFYLHGTSRELKVGASGFAAAVAILKAAREFTVSAWVRQERSNSGSLVSFSAGPWRYLEVQSSGRRDELRLHYRAAGEGRIRVEAFPFRLADDSWHRLALSVSGPRVTVLVDCHPLYARLLPRPLDTNFSIPQLSLWIGQRNNRHSLFKGALQDVRLEGGPHGYLGQCPQLAADCPTCGQFAQLQDTVASLSRSIHHLTQRLSEVERRLARLEECDCHKSCAFNGSVRADGATWQEGCRICACVHGEIECRPVKCPKTNCKKPVIKHGDCCPTCLKDCYLKSTVYEHGERVSMQHCVQCECKDGSMHCSRIDPDTSCPPLSCPKDLQFSVPEECCKFCPDMDYCAKGHNCHMNATCVNLKTTYTCLCDTGFKGDGHNCEDINECLSEGGIEGHYCQSNTKCVNTPGGYECQCLPGHERVDRFNCAEIDECVSGTHECDEHSKCINTKGSYDCQCHPGYSGDGRYCQPVCEEECLNGGTCIGGGCACRAGFAGQWCQRDLDECAEGLHSCTNVSSRCVNMPGWYYCACADGYAASLAYRSGSIAAVCQDVDECILGNHTCHPTAVCTNTEGSFTCHCPSSNTSDCHLSCMLDGEEYSDGEIWRRGCEDCECSKGVAVCHKRQCECSTALGDPCCPQCDPAAACPHQELAHVTFRSGERWIYQCQTCECLLGEVDCWSVECAPLRCASTIVSTTDCCPRCAGDDPCAPANTTRPCHASAASPLPPPSAHCSSCNCQVPFCDLLVSNMAYCVHRTL